MKPRDMIAVPFMFASLLFQTIAIHIGGAWTSKTILESWKKVLTVK